MGEYINGQSDFLDPVPSDGGDHHIGLKLLRAVCRKPINGICLSTTVSGRYCHYFRGRTGPCADNDCEACAASQPRRWLGYIAIWDDREQRPFMVELPITAARQLLREFSPGQSMRSFWVQIERLGDKPNGKVVATRLARAQRVGAILAEPDLPSILRAMWRAPSRQLKIMIEGVPLEHQPEADSFGRAIA